MLPADRKKAAPHPATLQLRERPGALPPHPATVAQRREVVFGLPKGLPPHPATDGRSFGGAPAPTSGVAQRSAHDKWANEKIKAAKKALSEKSGALHHKVSKERLDALVASLQKACGKNDAKAVALREFLAAEAQSYFGAELKATAGDFWAQLLRISWNLPYNLELGPEERSQNPGGDFDPNTEPGKPPSLERKLSARSGELALVDAIIKKHETAGTEPSSADWDAIRAALTAASALHRKQFRDALLSPPKSEQWITPDEKGAKATRKGLYLHRGLEKGLSLLGKSLFVAAEEKNPEAKVGALSGRLLLPYQTKPRKVGKRRFVIRVTEHAMVHYLTRHTYDYFSFSPKVIKAVNTFWPEGTTAWKVRVRAVAAAMTLSWLLGNSRDETQYDDAVSKFRKGATVSVGGMSLFVIIGDSASQVIDPPDDDDDVMDEVFDLATVAPDGAGVDAYTQEELTAIAKKLGKQ